MFKKKSVFQKRIPVGEWWRKVLDSGVISFLNKCFDSVCFKKTVQFVSEVLGRFFSVFLVVELLFLYSIRITFSEIWMGKGHSGTTFFDNFGSMFIQLFDENYFWFFFFPLLHFTIFFSFLSVFMWIYYRNNKKLGWIGFKNFVLSLLVGFMLIYFPIQIVNLDDKVRFMKKEELSQYVSPTKILSFDERREAVELYHSLYLEGLLSWRHDPLAVAKDALENGRLRSYSRDDDKLSIESQGDSEEALYNNAVVLLENERYTMRIYLTGKGDKENRVWVVYSYRVGK